MAKPKQKPLMAKVSSKKRTSAGRDVEVLEDESWVMVKKQVVRILIPPLLANEQCTSRDSEPIETEAMSEKSLSSVIPLLNLEINSQKYNQTQSSSPEAERQDKPLLLAPKLDIPTAHRSPRPISPIQKLYRKVNVAQVNRLNYHNILGVQSRSKGNKHSINLGGVMFPNQRMRALVLEKKLQRAGGLSRWLKSLGLDRFMTIFQRKKIGKFQLANLSMKKLKDMGANAVGPRRKLIHAIDCLCDPSCFRAL